MTQLKLNQGWLSKLLPEGILCPSSTLISGPGGSGKPLIGFAFAYDWLKAEGNIIFIPLQYPEMKLLKTSLRRLYDLDVDEYSNKMAYIQFNPGLDSWNKVAKNTWEANLLKSEVWDHVVDDIEKSFPERGDLGTLVFASALNLLLFSPTYRELNLNKLERIIREDKTRTYIISVSTSAFKEEIRKWENAADNLMFARMGKSMELYLRITKVNNKQALSEEIRVPVKKEILEEIKEVAESVRNKQIPKLMKI